MHLQNNDYLQKKDCVVLKSREISSIREGKKSSSKALKVQMVGFNGSDNSEGSTNDKVALVSKKFKQMMKRKRKYHHFSRRKDTILKKKYNEERNEII